MLEMEWKAPFPSDKIAWIEELLMMHLIRYVLGSVLGQMNVRSLQMPTYFLGTYRHYS